MNRTAGKRPQTRPLAAGMVLGVSRSTRWLIALALAAAFAVLLSIALQRPAPIVVPPAPTHYLDDRAGLLSPGFVAAKNQYLEYLSRTLRIANVNVVILPPAPVPDVEAFSIAAASAWKIGARGADNGLALFVFPGNRQMRLEVGYGLEYAFTDAQASSLLNEQVVPAFARGQYETGIEDFLSALDKLLTSSEAAEHRA
ncbi:MAG TPA: TPM domain-containing protein, partial [Ramlibacter sp.]|nr:TPM domain-containing protein [Ramlibacter sp.]